MLIADAVWKHARKTNQDTDKTIDGVMAVRNRAPPLLTIPQCLTLCMLAQRFASLQTHGTTPAPTSRSLAPRVNTVRHLDRNDRETEWLMLVCLASTPESLPAPNTKLATASARRPPAVLYAPSWTPGGHTKERVLAAAPPARSASVTSTPAPSTAPSGSKITAIADALLPKSLSDGFSASTTSWNIRSNPGSPPKRTKWPTSSASGWRPKRFRSALTPAPSPFALPGATSRSKFRSPAMDRPPRSSTPTLALATARTTNGSAGGPPVRR